MKSTRLLCAALIPLCALAISVLLLHQTADAARLEPAADPAAPPELTIETAETSFWPPFHVKLSDSADKDSGGADVDAQGDRIVVVWSEGTSAQGLNSGLIKIAWRPDRSSDWRTQIVPRQRDGFAHYQPAVALSGQIAHVVWVREDIQGAGIGNNRISYSQCHLDTGICDPPEGVSPEGAAYRRLAPDVALDAVQTPHVVWVRQSHQQIGRILYNNRKNDEWNDPEVISGGSDACEYSQDNPALAISQQAIEDQRAYVVWDENVGTCSEEGTAGIYFRQRDQVTDPSGGGTWSPGAATEGSPLGKQLSSVAPLAGGRLPNVDGFPTLDAAGGRVYVMWERLVATQTLPFYGAVYTYSLPYRVLTGTTPSTDWWPGGAAADQWAVMPFTSTSATDIADFYEGLRPELKLVGPTPHVVWHQWKAPSAAQLAELKPQDELPDEHLVDDRCPYQVSYATYRAGINPWNLERGLSNWISDTLYVMESDRILAAPSLALSTIDGGTSYQPHIALHRRGAYVQEDRSFGWDVWYTNKSTFYRNYVPFLVQTHP